jgi:hypothetical protein
MSTSVSGWELAAYRVGLSFLVCIAVFVLWITYFGPRQDRAARVAAETFCSSLVVGEDAKVLPQRALEAGAELTVWPPDSEITRNQVWFSGFWMNGFVCEVRESKGRIVSRYTEEHTW